MLVGAAADRARVRAALPEDLEVVAEASTQAEARAVPDIDAWVIARTTSDAELPTAPESLTSRELQVLELLAQGLPNKSIAARLAISDQTVKFHVGSICGKLGVSNRMSAVRRAIAKGLIPV